MLTKRDMQLLKYSEMLSQIQSFQMSFEQIELEGNLLDQILNELENKLSRV